MGVLSQIYSPDYVDKFGLRGSTFTGNNAGSGGAVYVDGGTFEMNGGYISDNKTNAYDCSSWSLAAQLHGAGVCVVSGSFTMNNGYITNNKAYVYNSNSGLETAGGGVFVCPDGLFEMKGGEISGNAAVKAYVDAPETIIEGDFAYGGGVCLGATGNKVGSFKMTGGTISGNTAGTSGNGIGVYEDNITAGE